jgi:hypothetical protein
MGMTNRRWSSSTRTASHPFFTFPLFSSPCISLAGGPAAAELSPLLAADAALPRTRSC